MDTSSSGKEVAGNLYLHRDAVAGLEPELRSEIWAAEAIANTSQWNVVKLRKTGQKRVSLLTYEDFERPFPALLESITVDLESLTSVRRSYRARANPPVLHRKELLLPADHPVLRASPNLLICEYVIRNLPAKRLVHYVAEILEFPKLPGLPWFGSRR